MVSRGLPSRTTFLTISMAEALDLAQRERRRADHVHRAGFNSDRFSVITHSLDSMISFEEILSILLIRFYNLIIDFAHFGTKTDIIFPTSRLPIYFYSVFCTEYYNFVIDFNRRGRREENYPVLYSVRNNLRYQ